MATIAQPVTREELRVALDALLQARLRTHLVERGLRGLEQLGDHMFCVLTGAAISPHNRLEQIVCDALALDAGRVFLVGNQVVNAAADVLHADVVADLRRLPHGQPHTQ